MGRATIRKSFEFIGFFTYHPARIGIQSKQDGHVIGGTGYLMLLL